MGNLKKDHDSSEGKKKQSDETKHELQALHLSFLIYRETTENIPTGMHIRKQARAI